jgi:two-component system, OmpR family, sensor histidine kinase KdpD
MVTHVRPSADALLSEAQRTTRGRLKVFLGASPGVGKTFEMLSNARRKQAEGVDVVIGIVETHGRSETHALLEGLELLPRRQVQHRGRILDEFDLDAALKRQPQLILVDELAHTNAPGSRHQKRHQDVQELMAAGMDVYTTLNVQHLESYNDLVERITGVSVRETVPDDILDLANDVELIDLPPDELIERLHQGKVYMPEQALRALDHFFTRGNLLALRELALRAAAERVDDEIASFKRARGIEHSWPMRGRVLVCIDATPGSEHLLRAAHRLAEQRHVPWTALHVQTLGAQHFATSQEQLEANLALAAELGGDSASITADSVGVGVLDYARACNASQIMVGRPHGMHRLWWRRSLAQWLFAHAGEFEVTVANITARREHGRRLIRPTGPSRWMVSERAMGAAALSTAVVTSLSLALRQWLHVDEPSSLYLLGVVAAGAVGGLSAALLACVLAFLSFNFFFTEPRYTLLVNSINDLRALLVFLSVGTVVGWLSGRLQNQAEEARRNTLRTAMLFDFSRRLATAVNERDLRQAAAEGVSEILGAECLVLSVQANGEVHVTNETVRSLGWRDTEIAAANWCAQHQELAGLGTATLPAATWCFAPMVSGEQTLGVIALAHRGGTEALSASDLRLLHSLQAQVATAWQRFVLLKQSEDAKVQRAAEQLRAALLASVSHDLRTPLVSVIGSLSAIAELSHRMDPQDQAQLIETALQEAERLNRLIQNLLDATRLAQSTTPLPLAAVDIPDVVQSAVQCLPAAVRERVVVQMPSELPSVLADRALLEQVLINLLENAAKYSPQRAPIGLSAQQHDMRIHINIVDQGTGIAESERSRVFDFFYRTQRGDSGPAGSGLGLAICKGFIDAMGGVIRIAENPEAQQGAVLVIELPVAEAAAEANAS